MVPCVSERLRVERAFLADPAQGMYGIVLGKENRHRLVIGVCLIQQAAAEEIDANDVMPV